VTSGDKKKGLARGLTNYGDPAFSLYLRRSFAKSMGYSSEMLGRPVVGIADSRSGFNNCHRHFPELIEAVKRGVLAAGGLPVDFPTVSLGEVFLHPTSMMFRNLMSIDVEEMIRAQPMDAVVRQDGAGAAHGRGLGRPARGAAHRRADDADLVPRRAPGRLHRL
jgi:dihydroxy-acid dehydratase